MDQPLVDGENATAIKSEAPEPIPGDSDGKRQATEEAINQPSPKRARLSPVEDAVKDGLNSAPSTSTSSVKGSAVINRSGIANPARPEMAHQGTPPSTSTPPTSTPAPSSAPSHQTRLDNLPVLSSLAGQLLSALAKMPPGEGLTLIRNLHLPNYQEYRTIRSLLEPVLGLYRTGPSFLIHTQLGMTTASQIEILRKANQALWLASIFTGEVGLRDMNQSFLFVFVPEQGKLSKNQGNILLELKTQAFITAHRLRAADARVVLADLFSDDMDQQILSRRSGGQPLAPSEQEFLKRLASRRDILDEHIRLNKLDELELRYGWSEFSKEISNYIYKTYGNGVPPVSTTPVGAGVGAGAGVATGTAATQGQTWLQKQSTTQTTTARPPEYPERPLHTYARLIPNNQDDWMAQLARAYEVATKEHAAKAEKLAAAASVPGPGPGPGPATAEASTTQSQPANASEQVAAAVASEGQADENKGVVIHEENQAHGQGSGENNETKG